MTWTVANRKEILKCIPFNIEELKIHKNDSPLSHAYYRIMSPDYVNILPITRDGKAIMIKQFRAGSESTVLEIPGGIVDPHENRDPTMAAARELEEETGFCTQKILPLLSVNPNPALQNNKLHLFLGLDCEPTFNRKHFPDKDEDITIELIDVTQLDTLVRTGRIDHSLCCLCIMLAQKYLDSFH
ncbi:MAG: NUDIX hydrolase [Bdellovibrionota bacterium]